MRASDLQGKPMVTVDGERLGHVAEIHLKDGRVRWLVCRGGFLQRFMASRKGRRVDWDRVVSVGPKRIVARR